MKFDFEPYKLFTVGDLKKGIKDNLKGNFTWGGYVKNTKPDTNTAPKAVSQFKPTVLHT